MLIPYFVDMIQSIHRQQTRVIKKKFLMNVKKKNHKNHKNIKNAPVKLIGLVEHFQKVN